MSERNTSKILIVDDDEGVTQTFARMLRLEGYQVRTAVSAEKAPIEAEQSHPDAIILDPRMPLPAERRPPPPLAPRRPSPRAAGPGSRPPPRARHDQRETPVAIVTGDYFLDDSV